jgi:hypothetical protein
MASTLNASSSGAGGLITTADASGVLQLQTAGTTAVTVDASQNVTTVGNTYLANTSGNVGIGTSSPVSLLQVGSTATSNTALTVASANNTAAQINLLGDLDATFGTNLKYEGNGNYFAVSLNNAGTLTERMRIDSNGRVQINDTATIPGFTAKLTITSPTNSESNITLKDTGTTYAAGTQFISFVNSSNTATGSIQHTAVTTVAYATTSDARLKENIADAPSSLDKIAQAKVRSFDWKEDKHHTDYGFIAQELYEVYPDAVCKGDDSDEITNPKETWQVDYGRLTPLLLKAIQELNAKVTALESKLGAQ